MNSDPASKSPVEPTTPHAFGAPGIEPRWTSSAKSGLGTAYHTGCRLWFTLSHGIVNEIYFPSVDEPNTRDFQFLISDGETFCHEEKRDLDHQIEYPEKNCLFYRLTNTDRDGRYRIIKQVLTDPHQSVLLVHTRIEIMDESLRGKLRLYALLVPHIARAGAGNTGSSLEMGGHTLLHAERKGTHLIMGCSRNFSRRSVGYAGFSDGWQDLQNGFRMDWQFPSAENGNIVLTGEIETGHEDEFTIAIAFGQSRAATLAKWMQSLADPFEAQLDTYIRQWQRTVPADDSDAIAKTCDGGHLYRLSRCLLLAHEDKKFQGALVASMSIPWGEAKGDNDMGGYHLVWTRDLVRSALGLLAAGKHATPRRALIWLAAIQRPDGGFPQNSWIDGRAFWHGVQLDEIAAPILLAWHLRKAGVEMGDFSPHFMIFKAAGFLLKHGPVTGQDRWEENSGYSPATLASIIAGLVCAAVFAKEYGDSATADFIQAYADWLESHIEDWTVTSCGESVPGIPRHYIRINPTDSRNPDAHADPDTACMVIANGGGSHPARNIVGGDFLELVRLGIRNAQDPLVIDSVAVIDNVLKRDFPQGPSWRRYPNDGYGQKDDGEPYDGTGTGRCWPILTGERGHYEIAAGRDPGLYIKAMEKFANPGGMLCEQLWDGEDLDKKNLHRGLPTGSAMPLCWSHAEYLCLVRSALDGICVDRIEPAYQRYVTNRVPNHYEFWMFTYRPVRIARGKILRILLEAEAEIIWSIDSWKNTERAKSSHNTALNLWSADFPSAQYTKATVFEFTIQWTKTGNWEGCNYSVSIEDGAY